MNNAERQGQMTMLACIPENLSFLETYRQIAWEQIMWDKPHQTTIRSVRPKEYMLRGLHEELGELTEKDKIEPDYNRLGALVHLEDNPQLQPGLYSPTAIARHTKEFGDVSWYLANYLTLFGVSYEKVLPAGLVAWKLDNISQPRCTETEAQQMEALFPWVKLFSYSGELRKAADKAAASRLDERILPVKDLIIAAGKFTLAMMHIAVSRFDTTYEDILRINQVKLDQRMREGTVFNKTGGDDR